MWFSALMHEVLNFYLYEIYLSFIDVKDKKYSVKGFPDKIQSAINLLCVEICANSSFEALVSFCTSLRQLTSASSDRGVALNVTEIQVKPFKNYINYTKQK